jgi:biotin-(acetyl-CoA carboxylase) ligase
MFVGNERRITMLRETLLQKLKENLDTHLTEYEEATVEWKDAARAFAEDVLERVKVEDFSDLSFKIPRPIDSSDEIGRAIEMVEYSTGKEIVLDEHTFRQWVSGEWSFRNRLHESLFASTEYVGNLRKK